MTDLVGSLAGTISASDLPLLVTSSSLSEPKQRAKNKTKSAHLGTTLGAINHFNEHDDLIRCL